MKRIFTIVSLCVLVISCSKVGEKVDPSDSGSAGAPTTANGSSPSADATGGQPAEVPKPTAAQLAAVKGGQEVKWEKQGLSWTVPKDWSMGSGDDVNFGARLMAGEDWLYLTGVVSPMGESFPTDFDFKNLYRLSVTGKKLEDARWIELDGVKGVLTREAMPEYTKGSRQLQWITYRRFAGQTQRLELSLRTTGRNFEKSLDTLYGILYTTKFVR